MQEFVALAEAHEAQAKHYRRALRQLASDCRGSRALTALKAELHDEFAREVRAALERAGAAAAGEPVPADEQQAMALDPGDAPLDGTALPPLPGAWPGDAGD